MQPANESIDRGRLLGQYHTSKRLIVAELLYAIIALLAGVVFLTFTDSFIRLVGGIALLFGGTIGTHVFYRLWNYTSIKVYDCGIEQKDGQGKIQYYTWDQFTDCQRSGFFVRYLLYAVLPILSVGDVGLYINTQKVISLHLFYRDFGKMYSIIADRLHAYRVWHPGLRQLGE